MKSVKLKLWPSSCKGVSTVCVSQHAAARNLKAVFTTITRLFFVLNLRRSLAGCPGSSLSTRTTLVRKL